MKNLKNRSREEIRERISDKIKKLWDTYPNLRFFQLLMNFTRLNRKGNEGYILDPWYIEDDDLEKDLDKKLTKHKHKWVYSKPYDDYYCSKCGAWKSNEKDKKENC